MLDHQWVGGVSAPRAGGGTGWGGRVNIPNWSPLGALQNSEQLSRPEDGRPTEEHNA